MATNYTCDTCDSEKGLKIQNAPELFNLICKANLNHLNTKFPET